MASGKSGRTGSAGKASPVPHTRIEDEQHLEDFYEFGRKLGQGSFGIVREVIHRATGTQWACKVVNKEKVFILLHLFFFYNLIIITKESL